MFNFYYYNKNNTIVVSNQPSEKVKLKYGHGYEIINSVKDSDSINVVKPRIIRSYPKCNFVDYFVKKWKLSTETKRKMSKAKKGKKLDQATKDKISATMKGKSNFEGKKHKESSKLKAAKKMKDNKYTVGTRWIYNPKLDIEKRIKPNQMVPENFIYGRSYSSIENL